jgi:hypothetical protein
VADASMMTLGIGIGIDGLCYALDEEALKCLGMNQEDFFYLVNQIVEQLTKAKALIDLG